MKDNTTVIDRDGSDTVKKTKKPKPPRKYKVIYHNDVYTPMEFVTWSLMEFFHKTEIDAQSLTLQVHKVGSAIAGIYEYQMAEQKIWEVLTAAKENQFPLRVTGETE
jgi:ATP-dependent Clp protease adaptor protein ClpS